MSVKDFQIVSKLGEGAYSTVYKVKRISDKGDYALKRVKLDNLSEKEKQNALNEVRILASCRYPNLIAYKEAFIEETTNSLCIVMEFADNGDLFQKITAHQKKGQLFPEEEIWNIFIQMTKGLKPLHDMKIFHRDLKSANVFMYKDSTVKLGDMNVSKVAKKGLLYTQTGTPYYASPEVWRDQPYDQKSDIWSLGCVLYEMTTLKPPFRAEDMEGLYKKVIRGLYPSIPSHYSQDLNNLIRSLLQVSPQLRPSCEKILSMSSIHKRMSDRHLTEIDESEKNLLLKTIRFPKSLHFLTERLPKANYTPLKTITLDKQKFLQTLAGHEDASRPRERADDQLSRVSESVSVISKKALDKSSLPVIKGANNLNIFLPQADKRKNPLDLKKDHPDSRGNNKKMNDVIEEEDTRTKVELKDRDLKVREKEKEKEMILRERAKQKAAEHQGSSGHLLLPETTKSYRSSLSKHSNLISNIPSTTNTTDHLSEIRTRDFLHPKNESPHPSSQSISVAVIKANQFHAGDGSVNYIQNKQSKELSGLPRKPSDGQLTGLSELTNPKIRILKKGVDSPLGMKNKPEPSPLGSYKKKVGVNPEASGALELSHLSPHYKLPAINYDTSKSKLPPLLKNAEATPNGEQAKLKLKNLSKAYNVNLMDDAAHSKKLLKRDLQYLGLGVSGKQVERNSQPLAIYANH